MPAIRFPRASCIAVAGVSRGPRHSNSPLHIFFPTRTGPRNNEITSARSSPAGGHQFVSAFGFRVRISRKSQRGWQGRDRGRGKERERSGSSLIIHHRVQPGETKMAALLPSANTLSSKEDSPRELSRSRPPRSGLTTTLFARPLSLSLFFSLRFETRRPCLADTDEDYQFSSVDDSKDSRREGGRERKRNRYAVLIGE